MNSSKTLGLRLARAIASKLGHSSAERTRMAGSFVAPSARLCGVEEPRLRANLGRASAAAILVRSLVGLFFLVAPAKTFAQTQINRVLPLVTFFETKEAEVYNWWAESESVGEMSQWGRALPFLLPRERFVNPYVDTIASVDACWTETELTPAQQAQFARALKAPLIMSGDIRVSVSPVLPKGKRVQVQLKVHNYSGKGAEVFRILDLQDHEYEALKTQPNNLLVQVMNDLVAQAEKAQLVKDSQNVELVVSGKFNHADLEKMKKSLRESIKGVQSVQDLAFENEMVSLSVQYAGVGVDQLTAALEKTSWSDFRTQVVSHDGQKIFFDVKTKEKVKR